LEVDYSSRILVGLLTAIWGVFLLLVIRPSHVGWTLLLFTSGALIFSQLLRVCIAQNHPRPNEHQHPHENPKT
jgi:hypothetical protein